MLLKQLWHNPQINFIELHVQTFPHDSLVHVLFKNEL